MESDNDDKESSSPLSSSNPTSSSVSIGPMMTEQVFGINFAMELFGPSRVLGHLNKLQIQEEERTVEEHGGSDSIRPPPVPPLYWRSKLFLPQRPKNSQSGQSSGSGSSSKSTNMNNNYTKGTHTAKQRRDQTLKIYNDQGQDKYGDDNDDDDFEYVKLWLWQALSVDTTASSTSLSTTTTTTTTSTSSSPTTNDETSNTKISHSLLYFDVSFDFVKPRPFQSRGVGDTTPTTAEPGTIQVSLGFCFLACHHPGDDSNGSNKGKTNKVLYGEYLKADPITSQDLHSHLESQQLDVSSVKPETLASIMAVEFLRCYRSSQIERNGTRRSRSIIEVAYPNTASSQQAQKVTMKIPYEDMMGVGLLSLTIPQDRDIGSDTTHPAVTRYTNSQLRQMYHDLVVQNSHYYNEEQRHRGILVAKSQESNSSLSPSESSQSNPSPDLRSNFSPSPGNASSQNVGVSNKDQPATKTGIGVKRKLDMIDGRKNVTSKVVGSRSDPSSGSSIVMMTLQDYKSKVVSAFEEWRTRQLTLLHPPLPPRYAVAESCSSSSNQPLDVDGNQSTTKSEIYGFHRTTNNEKGHAGTTAISEPTILSTSGSGTSQPNAPITAAAAAAIPPPPLKLPKKSKKVYRRRRA